jgi:putative aldouronate transport system permease protein
MVQKEVRIVTRHQGMIRRMWKQRSILMFLVPGLVFFFIFSYIPLYGLVGAFQKYNPVKGFFRSPWVGLDNFKVLITLPDFELVIRNTLRIGFWTLIFGYPAPIVLAFLFNEVHAARFKKIVQTISYIPYFISWVVASGIWIKLLSADGIVNELLKILGITETSIYFFSEKQYFLPIVILSGIWKSVGFSTIMYLSALTAIDSGLYEAADIDGANKLQKIWYISLPGIRPLMVLSFVMQLSNLLNANFDQIWTMMNAQIYEVSEVIDTYIFRVLTQGSINEYARGIAIGLIRAVVCSILFFTGNKVTKKLGYGSLY